MFAALVARLSRIRVTVGYTAALITVAAGLLALDPHTRHRIVRDASTNLHNLSAGRLGTLFDSAFITDAAPITVWLPGLVCLLALAELCWHGGRLILTFLTGHVAATLLVAAGLAVAVHRGWLPLSVSHASDVGMSYGAMAVFGALAPAIAPRWRPAWLGWWLPVAAVAALGGGEFTDVGHATALLLGMLMGIRLPRPDRWTTTRLILLAVAAVFAFVVLVHAGTTLAAAAVLGTAGALLGYRLGRPAAAGPPPRG